jgi:predicted anti-sigma-YlaC factor YlaD
LAIPALLGNDAGASIHVAHEQGSWLLAVAVGFLVVAVRPARAAAMLPVIAALAAGLAITMAVDIAAGRTQAAAEAPHGLAFLGLGLLWLLTREIQYPRSSGLARPA